MLPKPIFLNLFPCPVRKYCRKNSNPSYLLGRCQSKFQCRKWVQTLFWLFQWEHFSSRNRFYQDYPRERQRHPLHDEKLTILVLFSDFSTTTFLSLSFESGGLVEHCIDIQNSDLLVIDFLVNLISFLLIDTETDAWIPFLLLLRMFIIS